MLTTDFFELESELKDEIKLFYPESSPDISHKYNFTNGEMHCEVKIAQREFYFHAPLVFKSALEEKRLIKRFNKLSVYNALSDYTSKKLPWGSLTGIRPTRLAYEMLGSGTPFEDIEKKLVEVFKVSEKRAALIGKIIGVQTELAFAENSITLYVHIPFCPSKCSYCSFISTSIDKQKKWVEPYTERLIEEIELSKKLIQANGLNVDSVYVGGGTPTSIDDGLFERILKAIDFRAGEFTCEAGRPDTVTERKLDIMKDCGVTRVCVNAQTLNNRTLREIGRGHTAEQFFAAYEAAQKRGFRLNVDLICGLASETADDFKTSLKGIGALLPQNLTVHTLSVKRGADLYSDGFCSNSAVEQMVNYAMDELPALGYEPYYLYRQKQMHGNLENIGYCLHGAACRNNVSTMEEMLSVVACGAGAISKRIFSGGRIERLAGPKDVKLYVEEFDERMNKKQLFFQN